jgi:hypothetical protein
MASLVAARLITVRRWMSISNRLNASHGVHERYYGLTRLVSEAVAHVGGLKVDPEQSQM